MFKLFFVLGVWLGLSGCMINSSDFSNLGLREDSIRVDHLNRKYLIYFPDHLEKDAPLVFICHGYTGTAADMVKYTGMNEVADKHGFVVCYPQGTKDKKGSNFWQVGYSFNEGDPVDDVKFIHTLAGKLQHVYGLSRENTFLSGFSNGGDLCNLLAISSTPVFKAVAPVGGCMMKWMVDSFPKPDPIPILLINGTADEITLWDGDLEDKGGWGPYHSTPFMQAFWVKNNRCADVVKLAIPNVSQADGSHVILEKHTGPEKSKPVWIYSVILGGHDWPGGSGNMDFNASETIWEFFSTLPEK